MTTKKTTNAVDADRWGDPALMAHRMRATTLDKSFNETCPEWCSERGQHTMSAVNANVHWSNPLRAVVGTYHSGFTATTGNPDDIVFAHLRLSLMWEDAGSVALQMMSVWGHEGERCEAQERKMSIPEARNLVVALQHLIKIAETES